MERITNQVAILHKGDLLYDGKIQDLCAQQSEWDIELRSGEVMTVNHEDAIPALLTKHADEVIGVGRATESLQDAFVRVVEGAAS